MRACPAAGTAADTAADLAAGHALTLPISPLTPLSILAQHPPHPHHTHTTQLITSASTPPSTRQSTHTLNPIRDSLLSPPLREVRCVTALAQCECGRQMLPPGHRAEGGSADPREARRQSPRHLATLTLSDSHTHTLSREFPSTLCRHWRAIKGQPNSPHRSLHHPVHRPYTLHPLITLTSTLGSTHHETAASHSSLAHSGLAVSPFTLRWA